MFDNMALPQLGRRVRLSADIEDAARAIMPAWPLEAFIAANPLDGLRGEGFDNAIDSAGRAFGQTCLIDESEFVSHFESGRISRAELEAAIVELMGSEADVAAVLDQLTGDESPIHDHDRTASEWFDHAFGGDLTAEIDGLMAKWCGAFFDRGEATWAMPGRERGFFAAWKDLAAVSGEGRELGVSRARLRKAVRALDDDAADAAIELLDQLRVPQEDRVRYLRRILCRQPGWPSAIKYRLRAHNPSEPPIDLTQYIAIALFYEATACSAIENKSGVLWEANRPAYSEDSDSFDQAMRLAIWQTAYERRPGDRLLGWLEGTPPKAVASPTVQAVFCIDPRSEGLRRQLEQLGPFQTFGFAGFFGMPVRWEGVAGGEAVELAPALITPRHTVRERLTPGTERDGSRALDSRARRAAAMESFHAVKDDTSSKFALAEALGWLAGPSALMRTFAPDSKIVRRSRSAAPISTEPCLDAPDRHRPGCDGHSEPDLTGGGLSFAEQVEWSERALRTMGLTSGFAPLVMLCGHGSTTVNNPHASALDCGACGGNHGGESARIACALLNRAGVRAALADRGIEIPESTWFVAAEHDTTLDHVEMYDVDSSPSSHLAAIEKLQEALALACDARSIARAKVLPIGEAPGTSGEDARRRASDWAEVRPEWGLAGNYAMVIGPRTLTQDLDLRERVFLHSYDSEADAGSEHLETILTAPMVVAHWINMQYLLAASAPQVFSAGTKILHNVVGRLGVLEGPSGDLRIGLPEQSIFARGRRRHDPLRLLVAVEAPLDRIEDVVARNRVLQELLQGGWVHMAAREPGQKTWQVLSRDGKWSDWSPAGVSAAAINNPTLLEAAR